MKGKNLATQPQGVLFTSLAEQVRLPFVTIKHAAELSNVPGVHASPEQLFRTISLTSESALQLIDSYLLHVRFQQEATLDLEPVSLGSAAFDTVTALQEYAAAHNCHVDLKIVGKYGPVLARNDIVRAAFITMGYSFIEAVSRAAGASTITVAIRHTAHGLSMGIFSISDDLSKQLYKKAKFLHGKAQQPLQAFTSGSGAGIFVADSLLQHVNTHVHVASFKGMQGLAATMTLSRQLSFL